MMDGYEHGTDVSREQWEMQMEQEQMERLADAQIDAWQEARSVMTRQVKALGYLCGDDRQSRDYAGIAEVAGAYVVAWIESGGTVDGLVIPEDDVEVCVPDAQPF